MRNLESQNTSGSVEGESIRRKDIASGVLLRSFYIYVLYWLLHKKQESAKKI